MKDGRYGIDYPVFAVDWDGTCVDNRWPFMGDWLPGAVEALKTMAERGKVIINTTRVACAAYPAAWDAEDDTDRLPGAVDWEIQTIVEMLAKAGVEAEVWTRGYKPPATVYVDDLAVRYNGHWPVTLRVALGDAEERLEAARHAKTREAVDPVDLDWADPIDWEAVKSGAQAIKEPGVAQAIEDKAVLEGKPVVQVARDWAEDSCPGCDECDPGCSGYGGYGEPDSDPEPTYEWPDEEPVSEEGAMRSFETGATRNVETDLDYHGFTSPLALGMFGEYMHQNRVQKDGTIRDSDNWKKGIPLDSYIRSMTRHLHDLTLHHDGYGELAREGIEEALGGLFFNVQGYMHEAVKARLDDDAAEDIDRLVELGIIRPTRGSA
jgi:hypothetical protein